MKREDQRLQDDAQRLIGFINETKGMLGSMGTEDPRLIEEKQ